MLVSEAYTTQLLHLLYVLYILNQTLYFSILVHQSSGLKGFNLHLGEEHNSVLSYLSKFIAYGLF